MSQEKGKSKKTKSKSLLHTLQRLCVSIVCICVFIFHADVWWLYIINIVYVHHRHWCHKVHIENVHYTLCFTNSVLLSITYVCSQNYYGICPSYTFYWINYCHNYVIFVDRLSACCALLRLCKSSAYRTLFRNCWPTVSSCRNCPYSRSSTGLYGCRRKHNIRL